MSTIKIIDNSVSNTVKNPLETDNQAVHLSNSKNKPSNINSYNTASSSTGQEFEKRERSNSNISSQLDDVFMSLVKKIKKEKPHITAQKNTISRYYNFLYKSRVQSTIELNNINPVSNISIKQTNPINAEFINKKRKLIEKAYFNSLNSTQIEDSKLQKSRSCLANAKKKDFDISNPQDKIIIIPNNIIEMTDSSSTQTPISTSTNGNNIHVKLDITNININGIPQVNKNEKVVLLY
jgi:hypothetical protein